MKSKKNKFLQTLVLLAFLPIVVLAVKYVLDIRRGAAGTLADIVIDAKSVQGNVPSSLWQNIAQGGEEPTDMIKPVVSLVRNLQPELIRLDHLFDFFKVDQGNGSYDFSKLDSAVDSVLATGAKPMLSISYTPDSKPPKDWNQWYQLVKATAHHYSIDKKISGIYYEVWNEPDLFGGWHYNKDPNYSTLYIQTSKAIRDGAAGSSYKVGGPAITAYYSNWIKSLFATAAKNNLPLDFISWHKYTKNIEDFEKDFENFNQIISDYPQYYNIERLITEIGPNGDPDSWYDNYLSGVHLISVSTKMAGKVHRLFSFEAIDGPNPRSSVSSGWGMISHDLKPKPRYYSLQFLNLLQGQQLSSIGNGSWVSSLASIKGKTIQVLLVNYDPRQNHAETFPLTIQNLIPGNYQVKTTRYLGKSSNKIITATANYRETVYLEPNSSILMELTPVQ